ncbi:hypothetical protein FJY69_04005 [candidate division WOR-3 bacterium]|nr:hypothetical protein [candidate division WOR-3 bacterium]
MPTAIIALLCLTVVSSAAHAKVVVACGATKRYSSWYGTTVKTYGTVLSAPSWKDSSIVLHLALYKVRDPYGSTPGDRYSVAIRFDTPEQYGKSGGLSVRIRPDFYTAEWYRSIEEGSVRFWYPSPSAPDVGEVDLHVEFSYQRVPSMRTGRAVYEGGSDLCQLVLPPGDRWRDMDSLELLVEWDPPAFPVALTNRLLFYFGRDDIAEFLKVTDFSWSK